MVLFILQSKHNMSVFYEFHICCVLFTTFIFIFYFSEKTIDLTSVIYKGHTKKTIMGRKIEQKELEGITEIIFF